MEKELKRIKKIRETLELDLGVSELDLIDEMMEMFFKIIRDQWKEIMKLQSITESL